MSLTSLGVIPSGGLVSGIKAIVPCHFEIFFRDVLDKQLNKVNGRKGFSNKRIVFMPVVMEGHFIHVVGIDPGKGNDGAAKVAADVFDNGFWVAEIRFCINVETIFVFLIYISVRLFEGGSDAIFKFIQQDSMERFTEVRIIEVFYIAPETVIGISAFGEKAVDVGIPFKGAAKGMKDTNESGNKIFRFVQGEKEFLDDIGNSFKEAVKQVAVFKEKMAEGFVNSEDQVPVSTMNQFKGHGSRPVVGILGPACRAKFGMTAKRNKFKISTMGTAIHGTTKGGIPTVD